jgi:hypothetical protein
MPKYQICLEIDEDGFCAAHVPELLGLYICSESIGKTIRLLADKTRQYRLWLRRHGEYVKSGEVEFDVREIKFGTCPRLSGNKAALFSFDLDGPTNEEIKIWLRRARWNRQELMNLVRELNPATLDHKLKGKRSIREILHHIANCDWWYVSRLNVKLPENGPDDTFARLDWARGIAVKTLRNLTHYQKSSIFIPTKYSGTTRGEKWTERKVFRRMLEHEREHIENIQNILTKY